MLIAWIKGYIIYTDMHIGYAIVCSESGLGYKLLCTRRCLQEIHGKDATLFVEHVYIRDNLPRSYGFQNQDERTIFNQLIKINGISGGAIMLILDKFTPASFKEILSGDPVDACNALKGIKGLGPSKAKRIVQEISSKISVLHASSDRTSDIVQALEGLGYSAPDVLRATTHIDKQQDLAEQIREALTYLNSSQPS